MFGDSWSSQTLPRAGDEDNGEKDFFLFVDGQISNARIVKGIPWQMG
ncbi:MAG: hypothetical protein NPIRA06_10110 [Nitrospirales bacterium]|nr:MAG: hypothetical protein NPIRA06_10110 [Nitrospirales bacterium]